MAALAKMSNVVPSSRGVRASGELALELEGELGVVGADNGLLVGQLAPLDLTAFASFLTQPLDPGKTEKKNMALKTYDPGRRTEKKTWP